MSDLGSKAALQADIDAKVTTNGNGENTGARVRAALTNMVDTLSNGENLSVTPYLYLTSGSKTGIYRYAGVYEGKGAWVLNGVTFDPLDPHDSVIWVTGEGWYVTDANTDPLYFSASDVATPDLATGWDNTPPSLTGEAPLPSIAGYPGPTVQDVLEQIAARVGTYKVYKATLRQSGTGAPEAEVGVNQIGSIVWTRNGSKEAIGTLSGAFPVGTTIQVTTGLVVSEILFPVGATRNSDNEVAFSMAILTDGNNDDNWEANIMITTP